MQEATEEKVNTKDAPKECRDTSPTNTTLPCFPLSCGGETGGRVPSSLSGVGTKPSCLEENVLDSAASNRIVSEPMIQTDKGLNSPQDSRCQIILPSSCLTFKSSKHRANGEYLDLSQPTSAGLNSHIDSSNDPKHESDRGEQTETNSFNSLLTLLKTFELLEIKATPRLYTKLNDENKQHLPTFLEAYKNYTALNQKVDVSELCISSPDLEKDIMYCKNLFLKDRKGQFYLVIVEESCTVDLKQLRIQLNASRNMSFADEKSLTNILGLKQGEVTPLAVMQESARDVRVVFHESLSFVRQSSTLMAFHPFSPFLQVHLSFPQLDQFVVHCGKTLEILDHSQRQKNILGCQEIEPSTSERSSKDTAGNSKNKEKTSTSTKDFKTRGQDKKPPSSTCSADKGENWNPKLDMESTQLDEIVSPAQEAISFYSKDVHLESISDQNSMHAPVPSLTHERLVKFRDNTKDKMEERKKCILMQETDRYKEPDNNLESSSVNDMESGHTGHSASVGGGTPTIKLPLTEPAESTQPGEIISPEKEAISFYSKDVHLESISDQNSMHAPVPPLTLERLVECRDDTNDKMEERKECILMQEPDRYKEPDNNTLESSRHTGHSASVGGGTPTIKLPVTEPAKDVKKVVVKSFDRKGKLKSYIKKRTVFKDRNIVAAKETVVHQEFGTSNNSMSQDEKKVSGTNEKEFTKATDEATINPSRPASESPERDAETGELYRLSPKSNLPEVDEFYHHLKQFKAQFREVSVSTRTSKEIGPSVGVRCFLFKDRRSNFFMVISHECYQLSFWRLKKALRPKKKLDPCHPFDIMPIVGVDWQHFTPFVFMSPMAQRNKVHVYLTEKISLPHIILCIQHPFAQGRRIIMTSSQLQHLIGQFSANGVGIVEEKAWLHENFSGMFTQFDNDSVNPSYVSPWCMVVCVCVCVIVIVNVFWERFVND